MHPELFIESNVEKILTEGGYSPDVAHTASQEAVRTFRITPCFAKGQAFAQCLAAAKKMAKLLQRNIRQQEKDAKRAAKPKRKKGVNHG